MAIEDKLTIQVTSKDGYVIIESSGPISAANSPELRKHILDAYKSQDIKGVICDLAHVTYMDSSGLATMVEGIQLAEQHQKKFMLTRVHSEQVIHTFEIARLTDLFPHFESPKLAIEENDQPGEV